MESFNEWLKKMDSKGRQIGYSDELWPKVSERNARKRKEFEKELEKKPWLKKRLAKAPPPTAQD